VVAAIVVVTTKVAIEVCDVTNEDADRTHYAIFSDQLRSKKAISRESYVITAVV
jgi:hypothetical protein